MSINREATDCSSLVPDVDVLYKFKYNTVHVHTTQRTYAARRAVNRQLPMSFVVCGRRPVYLAGPMAPARDGLLQSE